LLGTEMVEKMTTDEIEAKMKALPCRLDLGEFAASGALRFLEDWLMKKLS